ncbi:General transcription factor II-I repeat domain-containing protein 2A [Eumeta japonica]|uniref:General transcription factor II-I repeat domain-containing protein 2A n=1 Tax=Eumeta variegata TaxID=151549 RepID=A0A4C1UN57_EUMVA|nr:General transcription factor II-I repeat domain-containing protein 2A [Eumeta japonica]
MMSSGMKRKVDAEGRQFQQKWTDEFLFILHNALDESTDLSDAAQLAIFIRGVDKEFTVGEELLPLQPLKETIAGKDIFNESQKMAKQRKNAETVYEIRNEIADFTQIKNKPLSELSEPKWICDLAFLLDLTGYLNDLNLKLQKQGQRYLEESSLERALVRLRPRFVPPSPRDLYFNSRLRLVSCKGNRGGPFAYSTTESAQRVRRRSSSQVSHSEVYESLNFEIRRAFVSSRSPTRRKSYEGDPTLTRSGIKITSRSGKTTENQDREGSKLRSRMRLKWRVGLKVEPKA